MLSRSRELAEVSSDTSQPSENLSAVRCQLNYMRGVSKIIVYYENECYRSVNSNMMAFPLLLFRQQIIDGAQMFGKNLYQQTIL